jgi:hypothetical protein
MKHYDDIGVHIPQVYLPRTGSDLTRWAVIACDQFTSQPEYWRKVEDIVGGAHSTLNLILPEVYLERPDEPQRIERIQTSMRAYLEEGVLEPYEGIVYVERSIGEKTRRGIMLCLDLEHYDYNHGSSNLIRATEGTILERIHPRVRIREHAILELPHILVLIDDPARTVIEPLRSRREDLRVLYDFDLMQGAGHLTGYAVDPALEAGIVSALRELARPEAFAARYGLRGESPVLLYALGDGNHSLASAKEVWDRIKSEVGMDHPARYALVEIENVHDESLEFEPIHRVLFDLQADLLPAMRRALGDVCCYPVPDYETLMRMVDAHRGPTHLIGLVGGERDYSLLEVCHPAHSLAVGTLQSFLDGFMSEKGARRLDYVHGSEVVARLGRQPGNCGFHLPALRKDDLFRTVILEGVLPRKAFSMGKAHEKRFYMECRRIF